MKKYKVTQQENAIKLLKDFFKDPGNGIYFLTNGKELIATENEYTLKQSEKNLYEDFRDEALKYFINNKITWWNCITHPSGHLLSSQISCINHLFGFRKSKEIATSFLKNYDSNIQEALLIDDGYIEFEKVGKEKLGNEKKLTRGENCTSIDAVMLGRRSDGEIIIFLIEWKYTETYKEKSYLADDKGITRWEQYINLLKDPESPIKETNFSDLFFEPFYQLMRQTLFGWQMIKRKEYGVTDWVLIDVVPEKNIPLRNHITSAGLNKYGETVEQVWKSLLKAPKHYILTTPEDFIKPASLFTDTQKILEYLKMRYHN